MNAPTSVRWRRYLSITGWAAVRALAVEDVGGQPLIVSNRLGDNPPDIEKAAVVSIMNSVEKLYSRQCYAITCPR
jgi:hypothetical protein